MVKYGKTLIGMVFCMCCFHAKSQKSNGPSFTNDSFVNCRIKNKQLVKEIKKFHAMNKGYDKASDRAISLFVEKKDDTTKYHMSYVFQYYELGKRDNVHQIASVGDMLVFFTYKGIDDIIIKKQIFLNIAKERFPQSFQFYKENHENWPILKLHHNVPSWDLIFQNDTLIERIIN